MATASTIRKTRTRPQPATGCKGNRAKQAQKRSCSTGEYGFLNHRFGTLYLLPEVNRTAEAAFFESANNLCALYGLAMPDSSGLPYPANIAFVHKEINSRIKKDRLSCFIGQDEKHSCCLATAQTLYTGHTLYYIPLRPFWNIYQQNKLQPLARLLYGIYHYLYKIAGMAYCGQWSFVGDAYQTIEHWIGEEPDEEEHREEEKAELENFFTAVADLKPLLQEPFVLENLQKAIRHYRAGGDCDAVLIEIAEEIVCIATQYPGRSVHTGTPACFYDTDPDAFIYKDQYISFYWSGCDCLSDIFFDIIDNSLQEKCEIEEPVAVQWFDQPQQAETFDFDFENRLFALLNKLAEVLNKYDHEEPDK